MENPGFVIDGPIPVGDVGRDDEDGAGGEGERIVGDVMAAAALADDVELVEVVGVHEQRELVVMEIGKPAPQVEAGIVEVELGDLGVLLQFRGIAFHRDNILRQFYCIKVNVSNRKYNNDGKKLYFTQSIIFPSIKP